MRKRLLLVFVCLILVGLGMLGRWLWTLREPVYHDKKLGEWLVLYDGHPYSEASRALMQINADALPWLDMMLRTRDSSWRVAIRNWLAGHKFIAANPKTAAVNHQLAMRAFGVLTLPDRRRLVPALEALIQEGQPDSEFAAYSLAQAGEEGMAGLARCVHSPNPQMRRLIAQLLGTAAGNGAPEVLAALQSRTNDPDPQVSLMASRSLGLIEEFRKQTVPAELLAWNAAAQSSNTVAGNLWDLSQGVVLLNSSPLMPGYDWRNAFSGDFTAANGERGVLCFQDGQPDGTVQFLEWSTAKPVVLQSFGVAAASGGAGAEFCRALRGMRLYARTGNDASFRLIYSELIPAPYDVSGPFDSCCFLLRNLPQPVEAREFRIELLQFGDARGSYVAGLFGFDQRLNGPMIANALHSGNPDVNGVAQLFLREHNLLKP